MKEWSRERFLQVTETEIKGRDLVVLLGRDIRTAHEVITDYCVTQHLPVYEDLAVLVESMAFLDRAVPRRRSEGWRRELSIQLPVYEFSLFSRKEIVEALTDAAHFLTGDHWAFEFLRRPNSARISQGPLPFPHNYIAHVIPFSDGLDSFVQARLSVQQCGKDAVLLVRAGLSQDKVFPDLMSLRVPRKFAGIRLREVTYRTRPIIFYTLAAIAAHVTKAAKVIIGENGQGSFAGACLPFADEWWFRSTHPGFVRRWSRVLSRILGSSISFEQPNLWKTKGEVPSRLRENNLTKDWELTSSCSARPADRYGHKACGVCGGCLLRIVSAISAGLPISPDQFACDVRGISATVRGHSRSRLKMPSSYRNVSVRAISTMEEFARLLDSPIGPSTIWREAVQTDENSPEQVQRHLVELLKRHRAEWDSFLHSLPSGSWVHEIVDQL